MSDPSLYDILRDHIDRDEAAHAKMLDKQGEILESVAGMNARLDSVADVATRAHVRSLHNESRLDHIDGRDRFVKWALGALIAIAAALGLDKLFLGG